MREPRGCVTWRWLPDFWHSQVARGASVLQARTTTVSSRFVGAWCPLSPKAHPVEAVETVAEAVEAVALAFLGMPGAAVAGAAVAPANSGNHAELLPSH